MNPRRTCAHCHGPLGVDYRALVAVARRAGVVLLAGATDLHHACATRVIAAARKRTMR